MICVPAWRRHAYNRLCETATSFPDPCGPGCGTAAATFTAVAPGHATIVAARTSCGEAMLCQGSAGHYQIDVVISS